MSDKLLLHYTKSDLTKEEIAVILAIAKRIGVGREGDILRFFVSENTVELISWGQKFFSAMGIDPIPYFRGGLRDIHIPLPGQEFPIDIPKEGLPVKSIEEIDGGIKFTVEFPKQT